MRKNDAQSGLDFSFSVCYYSMGVAYFVHRIFKGITQERGKSMQGGKSGILVAYNKSKLILTDFLVEISSYLNLFWCTGLEQSIKIAIN